jgi:hypothetical protein
LGELKKKARKRLRKISGDRIFCKLSLQSDEYQAMRKKKKTPFCISFLQVHIPISLTAQLA